MSKLAVITVVYNNYSILKDLFNSFSQQNNKAFHLFVIDLSDHKKNIELPSFSSVLKGSNRGYAHGVNLGLKQAIKQDFKDFCIINNDVILSRNFIDKTVNSIINHPLSIIGGKIYYAPGYEYHKTRYLKNDLGKVIWYAGGYIDWKHSLVFHQRVDEVDNKQEEKIEKTDFITGCLMCFDKKVVEEIGFWNEDYFLYYEDADYCQKAKQKNIPLYYDPSIVIWHKNAQSTDGSGSRLHQKYQRSSRLRFGLKYAPLKTKLHLLKNYLLSINN